MQLTGGGPTQGQCCLCNLALREEVKNTTVKSLL